jgi:hypothetical protein
LTKNVTIQKGTDMEMIAQMDLNFNWEIGKVTLNEMAYRVDKLIPQIATQLLEHIIHAYQEELVKRLRPGHSSASRAGIGRHKSKITPERWCQGRTVRKRGHRGDLRQIKSKYGTLWIKLQNVECQVCGKQYTPLLDALGIESHKRHDEVIEHAVLEAVIDTNYRRLIEGHGLDISLSGIHDYIVGSDIDELLKEELKLDDYTAILGDSTKVKKQGGKQGELRVLVGITPKGRLEPIGSWTDTNWDEIEKDVKQRIKQKPKSKPLFVYDGEAGLEDFLAGHVSGEQRCTWHATEGMYYAMWGDGHRIKTIRPQQEQLAQIIAIELPAEDYDRLSPKAIDAVKEQYTSAKQELTNLITSLHDQDCPKAVSYLTNLAKGLFTQVEQWLATGIVAPKTTSRLERLFKELGRRLKRIAWGWSDKVATKLSRMIMIKKYNPDLWKKYWLKKMGINGYFRIRLKEVKIAPCLYF